MKYIIFHCLCSHVLITKMFFIIGSPSVTIQNLATSLVSAYNVPQDSQQLINGAEKMKVAVLISGTGNGTMKYLCGFL